MVLVAAMGKVHAHNVQASLAELVNGLNRVGLGTDGADDGSPAQVALRLVGRVKLCQPFDLAAERQVVESSGRHCAGGLRVAGLRLVCGRFARFRNPNPARMWNLSLRGRVSNLRSPERWRFFESEVEESC